MIINRSHRFIFVHTPKTAGTSVNRYLSTFTREGDVDIGKKSNPVAMQHRERFGLWKHAPARLLKTFLGADEYDGLYSFGFVRNPYERTYSLYKFLKYNWRRWPNSNIMDGFNSLAEFLYSDFFKAAPEREHENDSVYELFRPQTFWLCDPSGKPIVNAIGKVEDLESDFRTICLAAGLPPPPGQLGLTNVGGEPGQMPQWRRVVSRIKRRLRSPLSAPLPTLHEAFDSERARSIVLERYAADFETFGYDRELPPEGLRLLRIVPVPKGG